MEYVILYQTEDGKRLRKNIQLEHPPQVGNYLSIEEKLYRIDNIEIIPYLEEKHYNIIKDMRKHGVEIDMQTVCLYCSESKTFDCKSRKHFNDKFWEDKEDK